VGTIFHKTHMPLQKWFLAVSIMLNAKKGVASRQLSRHLKVHRNTAWRISMKIREAMMEPEQRGILRGLVEMDETYIGGRKRRGRHDGPLKRGRGTTKQPVVGLVERGGKVKAKVIKKSDINFRKLSMLVRETIDLDNSTLITDEANFYTRMSRLLPHKRINHSVWYADGWIHTNSIESFWALLKRGIVGQFHKVSIRHLQEYINEFSYRFNHRDNKDVFALTIKRAIGVL
jgi:transposase-like protein